ncbi:MAG: DUF5805 domain-containing protein [Halorhabdus sp.]
MPEEASTSRTTVKTYVPAYQKDTWRAHAEDLDMSQSEFVKTMVQAGRRHFDPDLESTTSDQELRDSGSSTQDDLTQRVETLLDAEGALSWEELLAELTDDIETRLDDCLEELQASNTVKYSGRTGGYTLVDR